MNPFNNHNTVKHNISKGFMTEPRYFKITNEIENHHGFQYVTGLNVLEEEFNDDPAKSCCKGGLYFTDAKNIFKFLEYGIYLREVQLPINPDLKIVKDNTGDKWRANMIILGERYELSQKETFQLLIESGADVHADNDFALRRSAGNGHLEVVRLLIELGANVHADNNYALQ